MRFNPNGMSSIDKNASVLWSDNGFDNAGEIVYIWESFHAKQDVVEGLIFRVCRILRCSNHYKFISHHDSRVEAVVSMVSVPRCGLNRSLPNNLDLFREALAQTSN